ncbi:MAG: NAD(P)H-hydrate dehydratase [Chromatiales bacterium]
MSAPTTQLPLSLYRAEGVRALDRAAIEGHGIPGRTLMERAGAAVFAVLRERWPEARHVAVLCGTGNNGGDGFVVAQLAHNAGLSAGVHIIGERARVHGDALHWLNALEAAGVTTWRWGAESMLDADVIVDALLGTGLDRTVEGDYASAIEAVNASAVPVVAVDIPSGLHANTGQPLGHAVVAEATVTLIGVKQGLLTGSAPDYCGVLYFSDLDVPHAIYSAVAASARRIGRLRYAAQLGARRRSAHKGDYGHVVVVGGESGYMGAARLAGEGAARVGAGLVSVATRAAQAPLIAAACPVLMSHGVETPAELNALLGRATVMAVGPGLGRGVWGQGALACVLERRVPMVLDADALNLLSAEATAKDNWVLTPHPGEAARLLGCTSTAIQADRYAAARAIQGRYGGVCVLKGAGTVIAGTGEQLSVCDAGNPGMGSGGMGDVLTGVIAGLLAQGLSLDDAACLGVCLHAEAGDRAAAQGERGLIATDLMPWLRRLANP